MKARFQRFKLFKHEGRTYDLLKTREGIIILSSHKMGEYPVDLHTFNLREIKRIRDFLNKVIEFVERD